MGKSFKGFSKALSLILAVAMVVTCVPTSAYAAELLSVDESEDILVNDTVAEEASDALVDASASEEKSSTSIDTQKEADLAAAPEENTAGEEDFEPDKYTDDVTVYYYNEDATNTTSPTTKVFFEDSESLNGGAYFYGTDGSNNTKAWDSSKAYKVVVTPATGYKLDTSTGKEPVTIGWSADVTTLSTAVLADTATKISGAYDYESFTEDKAVVVISPDYFARYLAAKAAAEAAHTGDGDKFGLIVKTKDAPLAKDVTVRVSEDYPAAIPAAKLAAKYDSDLAAIDMDSVPYEIAKRPITGVKVYVGTGKETTPVELTEGAGKDYTWVQGTKVLTLLKAGINKGLTDGLTIKFLDENYTLTQANKADDLELVFRDGNDNAGSIITLVPQSATLQNTNGITAGLVTSVEGRKLKSISVVSTNPTTGVSADSYDINAEAGGVFAKIAKEKLDGNLSVTANVTETVTNTVADTKYVVTTDGTTAFTTSQNADSGKDYTFFVKAADGMQLKATAPVQYVQTVNGSEVTETATDNHDGSFTIPAAKMVRKTALKINTETADTDTLKLVNATIKDQTSKKVAAQVTADVFNVKDVKYGENLKTTTKKVKKDGEVFYFTVKPVNATYKITSVEYKTESMDSAVAATVVDATRGLYSLPATATGLVNIIIDADKLVDVKVSNNAKAVITINGEAKKSTDTVKTQIVKPFKFSVAGADSSIKITKVGYKIGSAGSYVDLSQLLDEDARAAEYTIAGDVVSDDVYLYVQTMEAATNDGGKYFVDFISADTITPATSPANNVGLDYEYDSTGAKIADANDLSGYKRKSDTIRVAQTATATLVPVIKKVDGTVKGASVQAAADLASATYVTGSGTKTTFEAGKSATGNKATVKAVKQGSDTLAYTLVQAATDTSTYNENLVTLTGEQAIKVEPHFIIKYAAASQEFVNEDDLTISATVVNGATDASLADSTAVDANSLAAATYAWTPTTGKVQATVQTDKLTAEIKTVGFTESDPADAVPVGFSIKDKDDTVYTPTNSLSFYPVVKKNYMLVPTVTIGGAEYFKPTTATLGVDDLSTAEISYKLYEIPSGKNIGDFADQDAIDTALEAEKTAVLWAREVDDVVYSFKAVSSEGDDKSTDFFSGSGNATTGVYTLNAVAKSTFTADLTGSATVNHVKVDATTINFTINQKQELIRVNIKLNDGTNQKNANGSLVSQKLGTAYADTDNFKKTENAPANATKPNTDPDGVSDGYQFKVTKGATIKLPEESDLTKFTDKSRMLTGWAVTTFAAGNVLGITSATTKYFKPGDSITILGETTGITAIAPVWSARYAFDKFYVDLGTTEEVDYTAPDGTKTKETVPVTPAANEVTNAKNNVVNINGEGKAIFATIKIAQAKAAATPDYVTLYPSTTAGTGIRGGKIEWFAFDDVDAASGVTIAKIKGETAWTDDDEKTAASTNTALIPEKLTAGKLLGYEETEERDVPDSSILYAKYTSADGVTIYSNLLNDVDIDQVKVKYTVDISGLPDEIEEGQEISTGAGTVKLFKSSASYAGAETDKFTWTVTPANLTIEPSAKTLAGNLAPKIKGVKAGTEEISVKLTYTDANGVSNEVIPEKKIVVKPASYKIALVKDAKGTPLPVQAIEANVGGTSNFYVQVKDSDDNVTNIAASAAGWDSSDTTIIGTSATTNNTLATSGLVRTGTIKEKGTSGTSAIDTLGSADLTVKVTINSKVYAITVPATTYYAVTFDGGANAKLATGTVVTDVGKLNNELTTVGKVTLSEGATAATAGQDIVKKYYKSDLDDKGKYTADLTPYTAVYTGTGAEYVTFAGWKKSDVNSGVMTDTKKDALTKLDKIAPANVTLYPNFTDTPIATMTTNKDTIVLDNQKIATTYKEEVVIDATPITTLDKVSAKMDADYTAFLLNEAKGGDKYADATAFDDDFATAAHPLVIETAATGDTARTNIFAVAPKANNKAGKATYTISSQNSEVTKQVTVIVKGPHNDGTNDHYVLENGEYAKDTSVTYTNAAGNEVTEFFDEDGIKKVAGIVKDKDGNFYVLKGGVVQKGYVMNADGKGHATYADPDTGKITPDSVVVISGVNTYYIGEDGFIVVPTIATGENYGLVGTKTQYLVDSTGKILTEAAFKALGVEAVKVGGEDYIVGKNDVAEPGDRKIVTGTPKFVWTPEKNKDYKAGTTPTAKVEVSFKSQKTGKADTATLDAVVALDSAKTTAKEKVFNATVTATGFYADATTPYDWTKVTDTKTYKVDDSGQGTKEGLTVEGLTEGDEFDYTGYAIKPVFTVIDNETGATLVEKTDYTVKWTNNNPKITALPATATVTITGKGNYDKSAITRSFKIVDPTSGEDPTTYSAVKSVKVVKEAITFDGTEKYPKNLTITLADKSTVTATWNGSDYDLSPDTANVKIIVSNNINKGSGNVTVYGSDFKKPAKTTFKIDAADVSKLSSEALTIEPEAAVYTKSGAKTATTVKFNGTELVEGRDYKLNYVYNNSKNAGEKAGSVYITGKNNFKGNTKKTNLVNFDISKIALTEDNVIVDAYEKVAPKSIKAKVYDSEGNEIAAKNFKIAKIEKDGEDVTTSNDKLKAGDEISVTVAGVAGSNVDEETEVTVNITVAAKMSSAKFNAKALTKYYNGTAVELDSTDMEKVTATVKINKVDTTLEYGTDYEIVGYKGNNKQGTMTVYVRGISDKVSGYGKFTVKLLPKPVTDADK